MNAFLRLTNHYTIAIRVFNYLPFLLFFFCIQIGSAQNRCISTQDNLSSELKEKQKEVDQEIYKRIIEKKSALLRIAEEEECYIPIASCVNTKISILESIIIYYRLNT